MLVLPSAVTSAVLMPARQPASSAQASSVLQPSGGTQDAGSASVKLNGRKRTLSASSSTSNQRRHTGNSCASRVLPRSAY